MSKIKVLPKVRLDQSDTATKFISRKREWVEDTGSNDRLAICSSVKVEAFSEYDVVRGGYKPLPKKKAPLWTNLDTELSFIDGRGNVIDFDMYVSDEKSLGEVMARIDTVISHLVDFQDSLMEGAELYLDAKAKIKARRDAELLKYEKKQKLAAKKKSAKKGSK